METWKAFEHNVITHSAAHHIMTIAHLIDKKGYARVTDVAKHLGITRSSASITLKTLKERGYIEEDENKFLRLSQEGKRLSSSILSNRIILIRFLQDVLQVEPSQAEIDACKMEHLLSKESCEKLFRFLRFLSSEDTRVKTLLSAFWQYECTCAGQADDCGICETECLMPEDGDL
ncbi:MAG: metal-dependent transcriptional regulator [bacterium]